MKKKTTIVVTIIAIIVLAIAVWFFGYHNRKSNDNLPSLTSIAQMDEAEFNKIVCGYRREQLVEVWGSPDESSSTEDIWIIDVKYNDEIGLKLEKDEEYDENEQFL